MDRIILDASNYYDKFLAKSAAKTKVSRNGVAKNIEKDKKKYKLLKSQLDALEAQNTELQEKIQKTKEEVAVLKKRIGGSHKVLHNLDISNADDAIIYNSDDVGYIIDGGEYHLEVKDDGDLVLTPMKDWRKSKKIEKEGDEGEEEVVEPILDEDSNEVMDFLGSFSY